MAYPDSRITSRALLKEYCLRRLGHPVIEINVDEEQCDDRIDDALEFFAEYHFDGVEKVFLKHTITQTDIDNEYIAAGYPLGLKEMSMAHSYGVAYAEDVMFVTVKVRGTEFTSHPLPKLRALTVYVPGARLSCSVNLRLTLPPKLVVSDCSNT